MQIQQPFLLSASFFELALKVSAVRPRLFMLIARRRLAEIESRSTLDTSRQTQQASVVGEREAA